MRSPCAALRFSPRRSPRGGEVAEAFSSESPEIGLACLPDGLAERHDPAMSTKLRRISNARSRYFGIAATGAALLFVAAIIAGLI
jgi:hypothetical protein